MGSHGQPPEAIGSHRGCSHGQPWAAMGSHVQPWTPLESHGEPWRIVSSWTAMGSHRQPWAAMGMGSQVDPRAACLWVVSFTPWELVLMCVRIFGSTCLCVRVHIARVSSRVCRVRVAVGRTDPQVWVSMSAGSLIFMPPSDGVLLGVRSSGYACWRVRAHIAMSGFRWFARAHVCLGVLPGVVSIAMGVPYHVARCGPVGPCVVGAARTAWVEGASCRPVGPYVN